MKVGLRIDVDTFRGTEEGVPRLLEILDQEGVAATFFFSVGPDNMGRHLWRLIKPSFLWKMVRSRAASLYGWDILVAGTAWPGRKIGAHLGAIIRSSDQGIHEIGLHAWDHHSWQTYVDRWPTSTITKQLTQGVDALEQILGRRISCSAAPGWRACQKVVEIKETFNFTYNSDCRGTTPFRPKLANSGFGTTQIPVTIPTFDEVVGRLTSADNYNEFILNTMQSSISQLPVYTIHAEVEGRIMAQPFSELISQARERGIEFIPLGKLLPSDPAALPIGSIVRGKRNGREGWLACQQEPDLAP